jgi:hypothetical protein
VDEDGNVYVAEGPASLSDAGSAFTKYVVAGMYVGPRFRRVGRGQVPSHNEAWISGGTNALAPPFTRRPVPKLSQRQVVILQRVRSATGPGPLIGAKRP